MKKNVQRILATILTVIMMISMLPSNVFAADFDADMFVEPAVEAVSVPAEEQEVESTVEYIYEEPAETLQGSSDEIQTVEAADPAADEIEEETEAPVVDGTVTLKAEGSDYTVTVTYDVSAGLPADADIRVKEVMEKNKKYDDYVAQAADTIASDVESLNYVRLFDITLVDAAGNELEPDNSVDVQIQLKDVVEVQDTTQVVHFAGEKEIPEVVETAVEGDTVSFETDGFSIYVVLAPNEIGDNARLQVNFVNGEETFKTVYVKKADVEGHLAEVLYDPGTPDAPVGKKFLGWSETAVYDQNTERLDIAGVRSKVTTKLIDGIGEGEVVNYYAVMLTSYELYYQDENENTFRTENVLTTGGSGQTTVNQNYTVQGGMGTTGFIGWVLKEEKDDPDAHIYENGETITLTAAETTLVAKTGEGTWMQFDDNDDGTGTTSYTPNIFVPAAKSSAAYKPANPTRRGYIFEGWFTEANGGTEYLFNTDLSEFGEVSAVKLYAHWTANPNSSYKVIVWAQKVTDDKNALNDAKTYDYVKQDTITAATDTPITEETLAGYLNLGNEDFKVDDLDHGSTGFQYRTYKIEHGTGTNKNGVSADGSTVVHVYYDRSLMTVVFQYRNSYYQITRTETFTGLYGQEFSKYNYSWPGSYQWRDISILNSFTGNLFGHSNLGGTSNKITANQNTSNENRTTIYFYRQNIDNPNEYTQVAQSAYAISTTGGFNITNRFFGLKPSGYKWSTSPNMPSDWNSADVMESTTDGIGTNGITNIKRGTNTYLHIKYDYIVNDIVFMYGDDEVGRASNVPFGKIISGYQSDLPADSEIEVPADQYFAGWYDDPEGINLVDWNATMPLANKIIYAVTKPTVYHVVVEMNGADPLPNDQWDSFWLNHGVAIDGTNFMNATKTEEGSHYTLVGYYTTEDFKDGTLWNFDNLITKDILSITYHDTEEGYDELRRAYGDYPTDEHPEYANTIGIFKLYARWRNDDVLANGGIHIKYVNPSEAGDYTYTDPLKYADSVDVIAADAPPVNTWPAGKRFAGWELKAGLVYQPEEIFVASSGDADIVDNQYWITLTATYVEKENRTPTHITWYKNYQEKDGTYGTYDTTEDQGINEPWDIYGKNEDGTYTIPTREGPYTFLGWAKDTEKENEGDAPNFTTTKTIADFLEWKDGRYVLPGTNTEVTQVAADEVTPYDGLYAIWEKANVYHSSDGTYSTIEIGKTCDLSKIVNEGYLYGGYYECVESTGDDGKPIVEKGTAFPDNGLAMTPQAGVTYYLKEVPKQYLKSTIFITYDTNAGHTPQYRLSGLYLIMDIDETYEEYNDFGFIINGDYNDESALISTTTADYACKELVLKDKDTGAKKEEYTLSSFFSGDFVEGDRLAVYEIKSLKPDDEFTLRAFFTTPDGVLVTGTKERTIKTGNLTFENQSWTSENGINYTAGSDKEAYYESGHEKVGSKSIASGRTYQIKSTPDVLTYTVTKVDDGKNESQVVQAGDNTGKITYAGKTGYVFAGWYLDKACTKVADFSGVTGDMTVYAKYVKASAMALSFTKKSSKSGSVTLKATLKITGAPDLADAAVSCEYKGKTSTVKFTGAKTTKSGKTTVSTYTGTVAISGLANNSSFKAAISYKTPDGTYVSLADKTCKYTSGKVTVK